MSDRSLDEKTQILDSRKKQYVEPVTAWSYISKTLVVEF